MPGGGPGLIRVRGAGFLFRRRVPGWAGSYSSSAGVYALRPTGGELQQVARGVDVPVCDQAARITCEQALCERQAWLSPSARRAGLGLGYQRLATISLPPFQVVL